MGVNKYNSEGYYDPTAYEALTAIQAEEKRQHTYRPLVYVCSPFSGEIEKNVENARRFSRFAVDAGCIPITPHLFFPQFLNDEKPEERELGLFMGIVLLSKCEELWVFGSKISKGMNAEIEKAKRKGQKVRYFTEECKEVQS